MRCRCCNTLLSDFEATRKEEGTTNYLDMCNKCFKESGLEELILVKERSDLANDGDFDGDFPDCCGECGC